MCSHQIPTYQQETEEPRLPHYRLAIGNAKGPIMLEIVQTKLMESYTTCKKNQQLRTWLVHLGSMQHLTVDKQTIMPLWSKQKVKFQTLIFVETRKCHIFIHFTFRYSSHFITPLTFHHTYIRVSPYYFPLYSFQYYK